MFVLCGEGCQVRFEGHPHRAHPGPGRDSRRRKRVSSSDDEVGSDDAPLVPPDASFSLLSRGPEFFSKRTPVFLSNRFTALEDDPGPELHVLSEGICSTESDTKSVACELRMRQTPTFEFGVGCGFGLTPSKRKGRSCATTTRGWCECAI